MADKRIVTVDYLNSEGLNKGYINNTFANALKGSKSGSAILIDDVSPVTHEMDVKVRGKNLFNKSTLRIDSATKNLTQINNGFTFQTNSTKATMSVTCDIFLSVGTYYCRGTVSSSDGLKGGWGLYDPIKGVYIINASSRGTVNDRFTITESKTYKLSFFASYNSVADVTMTFTNVQLELGSTATAYTPYVPDLTAVKVRKQGKNLLSAMSLFPTVTNNAVPIHFKAGQKYTISFTTTYTAWRLMFFGTDKNGTPFDGSNANANKYISNTYTGTTGRLQHASNQSGNTFTFTCNEDCIITAIVFWNVSNETNKTYSDFQLELGTTATDYEPYITPTEYTPNADGTVESVLSLYPNTTLTTDTDGVIIDCEYNRDINKAFAELQQAIISLGGNV